MGIFVLWTLVISPKIWPPAKPLPPKPLVAAPPGGAPTPKPPGPGTTPAGPATPEPRRPEFAEEPPIPLETPHYKIEFTNKGAGIRSMILRYPDEKHEVPLLVPHEAAFPHFALRHAGGPDAIESLPWKVERKGGDAVEFSFPLRSGVLITKTFRVDPATYTLKLSVDLRPPKAEEGKPPVEHEVQLELLAFNGLEHESPYRYEQYFKGVYFAEDKTNDMPLATVAKGEGKLAEAQRLSAGTERD